METTCKIKAEIGELLREGASEPVAHSLFREAWEQRIQNPRSAVVVGVAALEVGVKQCVADLAPATAWLVENLPSPPAVKILADYLPSLPARQNFAGKALPPPESILRTLERAVQVRNRMAHVTGDPPKSPFVREALEGIRDVLWLLDYYRGQRWALDHIRAETRAALESAAR